MPAPITSTRGLYAIVDPEHCAGRAPLEVAEQILAGGCAILQLRDKRGELRATRALAIELRARCHAAGIPFVLNDLPELAAELAVDGLHLGQDDLPIAEARHVVGDMPVGLSTHTLDQALRAQQQGADLIGFGPLYPTRSKLNPDPAVGLIRLAEVAHAVRIPVVAIGGITVQTTPAAIQAGATWVAVISATCSSSEPKTAAQAIHQAALPGG